MPTIASVFPILPGKLDTWKHFLEEMAGSRRTEMDAFERRVGMSVVRAWRQTTPQGDLAIVYQEGNDVAQAPQRIGALHDPFAIWFKQQAGHPRRGFRPAAARAVAGAGFRMGSAVTLEQGTCIGLLMVVCSSLLLNHVLDCCICSCYQASA